MIKRATVVSQRPSAAKKGAYLTILNDGLGELRAYATRRLQEGEEIVVSVQQGANRDPLSVEILNKRQAEDWLKKQEPVVSKQPIEAPEVSFDVVQDLIMEAVGDFVTGWDDISTNTICGWLKSKETTRRQLAKAIHAAAREKDYAVEGGETPMIYSSEEYPKVEVRISVITDDDYDPRANISIYEVM